MATTVLLEEFGDFDICVTNSVWTHPDDVKVDKSGFGRDTNTESAEKYLRSLGFKKVKTTSLTVGGEL